MRLLADARWTGHHGIGRFASEVLRRLPVEERLENGPRPLSLADPLWLACQVLVRRPAVLFSPGFNPPPLCPAPFVFTIHDLIHIETPEVSTPAKRLYYRAIVKPACRRAFRVLTVSEHSRSRILAWSGLPAERVLNVGNGVGDPFQTDGPRHEPGFPYILYVGNSRPHKNLDRLLEAFRSLARPDLKLVLAGTPGHEVAGDDELVAMYRGALFLVLPSLAEGFGLPALEAMACGTPVLVSRTPALLETTGNAALLFDPLDAGDLARTMALALDDAGLRARMRAAGLDRARCFSWDRVAARVLAVLHQAALSERP
ncbi:MAG: glycosyltransferase family 1 protein [Bryobacteraceae bacterium]|jgi:glycosyltransferase involved in cell wall biosynthesis